MKPAHKTKRNIGMRTNMLQSIGPKGMYMVQSYLTEVYRCILPFPSGSILVYSAAKYRAITAKFKVKIVHSCSFSKSVTGKVWRKRQALDEKVGIVYKAGSNLHCPTTLACKKRPTNYVSFRSGSKVRILFNIFVLTHELVIENSLKIWVPSHTGMTLQQHLNSSPTTFELPTQKKRCFKCDRLAYIPVELI